MSSWYDEEETKVYQKPKLATNRSMWKLMLFNVLTLGVYSIVFFIPFSFDLDLIAPKSDRTRTMNFLFAYILSLFTFSIVVTVWHYHIAERVEEALAERGIEYDFGTSDFWGWGIIGGLFIVGTFVYYHKLCRAMNLLCEDYNERGPLSATEG